MVDATLDITTRLESMDPAVREGRWWQVLILWHLKPELACFRLHDIARNCNRLLGVLHSRVKRGFEIGPVLLMVGFSGEGYRRLWRVEMLEARA